MLFVVTMEVSVGIGRAGARGSVGRDGRMRALVGFGWSCSCEWAGMESTLEVDRI
jgi:hypothetical protein